MTPLDAADRRTAAALHALAVLILGGVAVAAAAVLRRGLVGWSEGVPTGFAAAAGETLRAAGLATLLGGLPGVLVAVHLGELSDGAWRRRAIGVLQSAAALPGVVFGWTALQVLPALGRPAVGPLALGAVLGIMIVPAVALRALVALRAAPDGLREASAALGASPWHTAWRVVVPACRRDLGAAVGVGFARAAGETVAVQLLAARLGGPRTLGARILDGLPRAPADSPWNHSLFAMLIVLLIFTTGVALLTSPSRSSRASAPSPSAR